jgi:putative ABC transport system permease protein
MVLYVRSKSAPQAILSEVRRAINAAGPQIVIGGPLSGREIIDRGLFQPRIGVAMLTIFGVLGLALASIGLYGLIAYSVNHRRREIGLRMAMGAARGTVLRMILAHGLSLVVTGMLIGLVAAVLAARLFSGMLFGVSPGDPISLAGAALFLLGVSFFASYLPALRASRLDPMQALRAG